MYPTLNVIKVGGSLLRDADLQRVATTLAERRRQGTAFLVVASALHGVTDTLERAVLQALDPLAGPVDDLLGPLRERHERIARAVSCAAALAEVRRQLDEVERLLGAISAADRLSERAYARLLSAGERLSVPLLAAAVRAAGEDARAVTSEELGLYARGPRRDGACDVAASAEGLRRIRPELERRPVVLTGFYGIDRSGDVVLFGRGGSDDTACAVAAGLGARRLELWKDVPGFMSADPRKVARARVVPELSFEEVERLGEYGSDIVHHGCLRPLRGQPVEFLICSPEATGGAGTRLVEGGGWASAEVTALAGRSGFAEYHLRNGSAGGERQLTARTLASLHAAGVAVKTLATSADGLRLIVAGVDSRRAEEALGGRRTPALKIRRSLSRVGVVGDGVATDAEISSRMLACISGFRNGSEIVVEPSSHTGLSCRVPQEALVPALNALHDRFFAAA